MSGAEKGWRRGPWCAWLAATLLCLAGSAHAQGEAGAPIRLGMIEGLSGPFANAGDAVARNLSDAALVLLELAEAEHDWLTAGKENSPSW